MEEEGEASSSGAIPLDRPSANLPLALTSFVGREREIAEVKRLLVGETRLLTLTGVGGSGKTRLALAVAREAAPYFQDDAWWAGLASLSDPELVPQAVAQVLGVRETPGTALAESLLAHLQDRRTLLVLDNCEHLVEACAALATTLLVSCPNLKILATSREALGVAGENAWTLPPLSVPDPEPPLPVGELARYEAVRLFAGRAAAASAFELTGRNAPAVAGVCRRLEGIPLAIEFAAARTKILSPEQILERLKDPLKLLTAGGRTADPRQRTLRATLEWSYGLLDEQERELFGRMSVFAGGWTLEAAETVAAGDGIRRGDVLELHSGMVEKSLIVAEASPGSEDALRYRMLEPVRHYGLERLEGSEVVERVRDRHFAFFLALAEGGEPGEKGARLERLETEHDNLRAALSWSLEAATSEPGLQLGGALGEFWYMRGHLSEGRRWLEAVLAKGGASGPARIKPLAWTTTIATEQGDYERALAAGEECLSLSRTVEDEAGVVLALFGLGTVEMHRNELGRAAALMEEAIALQRASEDTAGVGRALPALGLVVAAQHDYERALTLYEESLMLARAAEDDFMIGFSLGVGALVYLGKGDHQSARALCAEGLDRSLRQGMLTQTADILHVSAALAGSEGQVTRSARLWGAAEALRETLGTHLSPVELSHYAPYIAAARAQLDEAAWEAAWSEGRQMTPEQAIGYTLSEGKADPPPPLKDTAGLSGRELEVLRLVAEGLTDAQVASRLYISPRTVGFHLRSVYRKLGVPSRAAAAKAAVERSLI